MKKSTMQPIRVVIADDHPSILEGIQNSINSTNIVVVGVATDGEKAIELCADLHPHILILDIEMPKKDGFEVVYWLAGNEPQIKVVVFTAHQTPDFIFRMLDAKVNGYILKSETIDTLIDALVYVFHDKLWFSSRVSEILISHAYEKENQDNQYKLTNQEIQILRLMAQGKTDREIGRCMSVSERTIRYHLLNIYNKVGVDGRIQAVVWAIAHQLVEISSEFTS